MMRNGREVDSVTQMTVALSAQEISFFAVESGFKIIYFFVMFVAFSEIP
jgi:hypothetical protein